MTKYVALVGNFSQFRQWCKNNRLSYLKTLFAVGGTMDALLREELAATENLGVILFESWEMVPDYDSELTDWLLNKATSIHPVEKFLPIVQKGEIVAWKKKGKWRKGTGLPLQTFATRLNIQETAKLRHLIAWLSKTSGETTVSSALKYALKEVKVPVLQSSEAMEK